MKANHWVTVGMLLGAIGMMIGGLDHWEDAIKPSFVSGALLALGSVLKGIKEERPGAGQ